MTNPQAVAITLAPETRTDVRVSVPAEFTAEFWPAGDTDVRILALRWDVFRAELPAPEKAATLSVAGVTVYLPLAGMVDLDAERKRKKKEIDELDKHLGRVSSKLENPGFVNKAPAEVVERERARMEEMQTKRTQLSERLADLAA